MFYAGRDKGKSVHPKVPMLQLWQLALGKWARVGRISMRKAVNNHIHT